MIKNPINDELDIIILAGQSNAESSGLGETENPWVENTNILMLKGDYQSSVEKNDHGNEYLLIKPSNDYTIELAKEREAYGKKFAVLALLFALKYLANDLEPNRKILIVHTAVGGTGFANNHWGKEDVLYKRMISMVSDALKMNPKNRVVAMLWHQGEHDAYEQAWLSFDERKAEHKKNLTEMLSGIIENFGNVPFVSAGFTRGWHEKYSVQIKAITEAIKESCLTYPTAGFVDKTVDLESNDDILHDGDRHFCRRSIDILGGRYYEKYKEITTKN
jgi:hypothetical protein